MPLVPSSEILVTCVHLHKCLMQLLIVMVYQIILQSTLNAWVCPCICIYVTSLIGLPVFIVLLPTLKLLHFVKNYIPPMLIIPSVYYYIYFLDGLLSTHIHTPNHMDNNIDFVQMLHLRSSHVNWICTIDNSSITHACRL